MASEVEICNMALSQVRAGSINSLDQSPPTAASQYCRLWYPICRDVMLENSVWNFARRIAALAQLSNETVFNWRYVYAYPTDCLHIVKIIPNIQLVESDDGSGGSISPVAARMNEPLWTRLAQIPAIEYEVMTTGSTQIIVCNEPAARILYRSKITDPNKMPTQFRAALALYLASYIAIPLAGETIGKSLRAEALLLYRETLLNAEISNVNEGYKEPAESEYITVRN